MSDQSELFNISAWKMNQALHLIIQTDISTIYICLFDLKIATYMQRYNITQFHIHNPFYLKERNPISLPPFLPKLNSLVMSFIFQLMHTPGTSPAVCLS